MRTSSRLLAAFLGLVLLAGCAGGPGFGDLGPKQTVGALAGAGAGALAGSQIGGGRGKLVATSVGTLLGAVIGSSVGKSLDRADRIAAGQAQVQALEFAPSGQQVAWRNPDSGYFGSVTALSRVEATHTSARARLPPGERWRTAGRGPCG